MKSIISIVKMSPILSFLTAIILTISQSKQFDKCELARELKDLDMNNLAEWVCIAEAESHFNSSLQRIHSSGASEMIGFGLFQIDNRMWCTDGKRELRANKCQIYCEQLLDTDLTDDVQCLKTIYQNDGFDNWDSWRNNCKHKNLKSYLDDCIGLSTHFVGQRFCNIDTVCKIFKNAQCSFTGGVKKCLCSSNGQPGSLNENCFRLPTQIGGECETGDDCSHLQGSICKELQGGRKQCLCTSKSRPAYVNNDYSVYKYCFGLPTEVGGVCETDVDCFGLDGTECSNSTIPKTCKCKSDYYNYMENSDNISKSKCLTKKTGVLGAPCDVHSECKTRDSECVENICECEEDYVRNRDGKRCLKIVETVDEEYCTENRQCKDIAHAQCARNSLGHMTCMCSSNFTKDRTSTECLPLLTQLGMHCEEYNQCRNIPGAHCVTEQEHEHPGTDEAEDVNENDEDFEDDVQKCFCREIFVENQDRTECLPMINYIGEMCEETSQCKSILNADCLEDETGFGLKRCQCGSNQTKDSKSQKCLPLVKTLGEFCDENAQCVNIPNSDCLPDIKNLRVNVCRCKEGTVVNPENNNECLETLKTSAAPQNESFTDVQLKALRLHNELRQKHQSPPLQLSQMLSQLAQEWAEHELNKNSLEITPGKKDYSQNLYKVSGRPGPKPEQAIELAVRYWYKSVKFYNFMRNSTPTGFTQIVWKSTTQLGVGIATNSKGETVIVCAYYPKGNTVLSGSNDKVDPGYYFKQNVFPPK